MKILLVRVSSLGDVVHNMPIVADLRRQFPAAIIDWVVEEAYVDLVRMNPEVGAVIPFPLRRWRKQLLRPQVWREMRAFLHQIRQQAYDLVLDTQGLVKTGLVLSLARLASEGQRVGLANATEGSGYEPLSRMFHTRSVPVPLRCHAVQRGRLMAAESMGYAISGAPDFGLAANTAGNPISAVRPAWMPANPYAVFFHGTAGASKKWAPENWMAIAHVLAQRGMDVLLPWGSEQERQVALLIAGGASNCKVLPRLPLMEAIALARHAAIVIGVDTGLTHIAAAFFRPTIEIYCDSPRWKTEGNWSECIINLGDQGAPPELAAVEHAIAQLLTSLSRVSN